QQTQSHVMPIFCYHFVLDFNCCALSIHSAIFETIVDLSALRVSTSGLMSTVTTTTRSTLRSWSNQFVKATGTASVRGLWISRLNTISTFGQGTPLGVLNWWFES
ncbi:MAG: hypothetical protein ACKPKO_00880, partial [Candidatus Fonsibacter sp.]